MTKTDSLYNIVGGNPGHQDARENMQTTNRMGQTHDSDELPDELESPSSSSSNSFAPTLRPSGQHRLHHALKEPSIGASSKISSYFWNSKFAALQHPWALWRRKVRRLLEMTNFAWASSSTALIWGPQRPHVLPRLRPQSAPRPRRN